LPWAKVGHERAKLVYEEFFKNTVLLARGDIDITVKEYLVSGEILKRDFTKRQLKILQMIIYFSYNFGKETALIPKISDISISGVPINKVYEEVNKLVETDVIHWDKDFNEFSFNDPRNWKIPYMGNYDDSRARELFLLNLKHTGVDIEPIITKLNENGL
jgi:hypothetical protein